MSRSIPEDRAREAIAVAESIVVLTGAGISAESGIPTFRDAMTGLWARYRPEDLATPEAFRRDPRTVWDWYAWRRERVGAVEPNAGHVALARLERHAAARGAAFLLVTQNVDGLHAAAGSVSLVELHGNIRRVKCLEGGHPAAQWPRDAQGPPPCVVCGSPLRPDVVWFGEALPPEALQAALQATLRCDLFLSIGTSGLVEPAASLPYAALERGAKVIEVNPQPTPLAGRAWGAFAGKAGDVLPRIVPLEIGGMTQQDLALAGLKVVELGTLIAGPYCARLLAEFGAEVVKVETPGEGDPLRKWRRLHEGNSLWWYAQARNKKSVAINLKDLDGQAVVRRLAENADIVVENFRPGTLEKWNLGYERLAAANPGLVMVRLSGFGQSGPYRDQPGFGAIGESMGGMRYITGYPDRAPVRVGISIGDSLAAMFGVIGALTALRHREKSGRGQVVDVALYEAVFAMMESMLPEFAYDGSVRERTGAALPGIVPSNTYRCADGRYVVIGANADSIFKRMMRAIGRTDLADDPGLASNEGRVKRTEELDRVIGEWAGGVTLEQALELLARAEVPSGKIYSIADIVADPHFAARGMFERHRLGGREVVLPGIVPRLSATPGRTRWIGPRLGEHTDEVLRGLGYPPEEIAAWRGRGVVA